MRALLLVAISAAVVSCNGLGGVDAGPTMGTFHVDDTNIAGANIPASIDAASLHAFIRAHQPATPYGCGTGPLTEVIGITADNLRMYVRLPQIPPLPATQTLGPNVCGPYFSIARYPGLPTAEEWVSQSGTIVISAASGSNFTLTITGAAMASVSGTPGTFTASAVSMVMAPLVL